MNEPNQYSGVRASDAERDRIAKLLESAASEGRLTPDEAGERLAAASAAIYREELGALISDLPAPRGPDIEGFPRRRGRAWWMWSAVRFALVAIVLSGLWGLWGMRLFLWPLGFIAFAVFLAPWRRRRWRRWQRWHGAWALRGPYRHGYGGD